MFRRFALACTASLSIFLSANGQAQTSFSLDLTESRTETEKAVQRLRQIIADRGSSALRSFDASIVFRSANSIMPNAEASRDASGRRQIVISSGLNLAIAYRAEAAILEADNRNFFGQCAELYYSYLADVSRDIRQRLFQQQPLAGFNGADLFAKQQGPVCQRMAQSYPLSLRIRQIRDAQVADAIAFIYLHELGHHALNHVGASAQDKEVAADCYAVDRAIDLNIPALIWNASLWGYLTIFSGIDTWYEEAGSHPIGPRRQLIALNRFKDRIEARGDRVPIQYDELIRDTRRFMERAERELGRPSGSSGRTSC